MGSIGKWGVTRDADGTLSLIWEWPWYWRYPAALGIAIAGIVVGFWLYETKPANEWMAWAFGLGGVFFALATAYELGCLALVVGFWVGAWLLLKALFPEIELSLGWKLGLLTAGLFYVGWLVSRVERKADASRKTIEALTWRVNELENSLNFNKENLWAETSQLDERLRRLEARS